MYRHESMKKMRSTALAIDLLHIATGILIVILAIVSFLNPEDHMMMFPLIFLLAAILNTVNGVFKIRMNRKIKKRKFQGYFSLVSGIFLFVLTIISALSIWWG